MFGRFFAFEMGCPAHVTFHDNDVLEEDPELGCTHCQGMGCDKCKRKKKPVKVVTLTGEPVSLPVMNLPQAPGSSAMAMLKKEGFF